MKNWPDEKYIEYILGQILGILQKPQADDQEYLAMHRDNLLRFSQ